jgi:apolipoprotein N-acyltransferase
MEVVIVQPNIDPYTEKFGGMTEAEQMTRILELAQKKISPNTKYVIAPETAVPRSITENDVERNYGIQEIRKLIQQHPNINFIIGASSYIEYPLAIKKPTSTARPMNSGGWYDAFNTALQINTSSDIQFYHKSKLVLGVEKLPYPKFFSMFEKFAINLGGTMGSLGTEKESHNLTNNNIQIAPVICYESIYGDYVASYIKKGANAIFIITNDGWWEDTPGYKQHLSYARLRAIENRRTIARSANTGISCIINQRGDITKQTEWWKQDVLVGDIQLSDKITYFTKNGDYLGRISGFISILLLIWSWTLSIKEKIN